MFKHSRLLSILAFALLLIGTVLVVSAAGALPASPADTPWTAAQRLPGSDRGG